MKGWLRRWLLELLADDIETIVNRELVESPCEHHVRLDLDGEEIRRIAHRETASAFETLTNAMARQRCGKD